MPCKYLIFFPISELAAMKQPKYSLHLPWSRSESESYNVSSFHGDVIPVSVFIIPFESKAKTKRNIYSTEQSQYLWHCPCIYVSTPFGDLWSKHYRLCDSKLSEVSLRLSTNTKSKPWVDCEPRSAHGCADKNNKDKGRVDYEPRLAHGRAVKKQG